jgi:hypothetical protein
MSSKSLNPMDWIGTKDENTKKHITYGLISGIGLSGLLAVMDNKMWYLWGPLAGFSVYEVMNIIDTRKNNQIENQVNRNTGLINTTPSTNGNQIHTDEGTFYMGSPFGGGFMF